MEKYLVGGAVRDHLLHIDSRDRDYVVVGSSFDEMLQLGFKQVGVAFPVFLHPETGEEYALARRERKTAPGYSGFEVEFGSDVTLEEDLFRRDLTINSMAMTDNFQVIDPYGGVKDLEDGVLRHTSEAFADDPLRVLRLARFAARYGFRVANETMELARKLVSNKELDALSADRVWVEVEKLLKEKNPLAGLCVLKDAGCEQVESLNTLLNFSSVDYYESLSSKFVDLNFDMKAYTFTEVARLTNVEANTLRVPSDLLRKMRFYQKFTFLMTGYFECFETFAVEMFDAFRMEMNKKDYLDVVVLLNKMHGNGMTYGNLETIEHVYKDFCNLDLEAFVKTAPPNEIKNRVRELKLKTVADSLRNYRPHVIS